MKRQQYQASFVHGTQTYVTLAESPGESKPMPARDRSQSYQTVSGEPGTPTTTETREGRTLARIRMLKKGQEGLKPGEGRVLCEFSRYVVHAGSDQGA